MLNYVVIGFGGYAEAMMLCLFIVWFVLTCDAMLGPAALSDVVFCYFVSCDDVM